MNVLRLRSFDKHVIVQSILVCARMDKVYHHLRRLHRAISILFPFMPLKITISNDNRLSIYNQYRIMSLIMSHYLWLTVYDVSEIDWAVPVVEEMAKGIQWSMKKVPIHHQERSLSSRTKVITDKVGCVFPVGPNNPDSKETSLQTCIDSVA